MESKNRFEVTFELITQSHDQGYNPTFESEVLVEGISGGKGTGYSKKESQQMAARVALGKSRMIPVLLNVFLRLRLPVSYLRRR